MSEQIELKQFQSRKNLMFGLGLILVGCVFLFDRIGMINAVEMWYLFPAMIALSGLIEIVDARHPVHIVKGCYSLVFAFWLYASIEQLWGWSFHTSWPILLIATGAKWMLTGLLTARK